MPPSCPSASSAAHRPASRARRARDGTLAPGGAMDELELVGLHDDGEHIVLAGPDGTRYRLRIDEPLRAAARRDRPRMELLRAEGTSLPPREIQSRVRAGEGAGEGAEAAGLPVEVGRGCGGPVLAARGRAAEPARERARR